MTQVTARVTKKVFTFRGLNLEILHFGTNL